MSASVAPPGGMRFPPRCRRNQLVFNRLGISGTVKATESGLIMKHGIAVGLALAALTPMALAAGLRTASAQDASQCSQFQTLSQQTQIKANAVSAAMKAKGDRAELCKLMGAFVVSEATTVKFLVDNKTWCGVPDQMIGVANANHQKSLKMRDAICSDDAPHPKAPSLSDAIKTPPLDSATNTKTGSFGTFDSLTGNPLG